MSVQKDIEGWKNILDKHMAVWGQATPEVIAKVMAIPPEEGKAFMEKNFASSDANGDGKLNLDEFRAYAAKENQEMKDFTGWDMGSLYNDALIKETFEEMCRHCGVTELDKAILERYQAAFDTYAESQQQ